VKKLDLQGFQRNRTVMPIWIIARNVRRFFGATFATADCQYASCYTASSRSFCSWVMMSWRHWLWLNITWLLATKINW